MSTDIAFKNLAGTIERQMPGALKSAEVTHNELVLTVNMFQFMQVMTHLRDDPNCLFTQLIDIAGVDYPEREQRFDVVYQLLSLKHNRRVRVKISTDDKTPVPSISALYSAAGWFEREAWDMYGILFSDHPDLRRILTDYGFDGHPQRRDFPLTGYVELRYDNEQKRVVYEPVKLTQAYRSFDYLSPWEGPSAYVLPGDEKATGTK